MINRSAHVMRAVVHFNEAKAQPIGSRPRTIFMLRAIVEIVVARGAVDEVEDDAREIERTAYRRRFGRRQSDGV